MIYYFLLFVIGLILAAMAGYFIRPLLIRWNLCQPISEYVEEHKAKDGTPTCGGLLFIIPSVIGLIVIDILLLIKQGVTNQFFMLNAIGLLSLANGAIGFLDDWMKKHNHKNEGLKVFQKLFLQLAVSAVFVVISAVTGHLHTAFELIPGVIVDWGIGYYIISVILITLFCNAVNLTDGMDGLAGLSSVILLAFVTYLLAFQADFGASAYFVILLAGSVAGFLFWNMNPAKLFMGDTGSLFIGAVIGGVSVLTHRPVLLLLCSLAFLADLLSSALQVLIFKITKHLSKKKEGWRLFKKAPLHHTFHLCGWSETQICFLYAVVTVIAIAGSGILFHIFP